MSGEGLLQSHQHREEQLSPPALSRHKQKAETGDDKGGLHTTVLLRPFKTLGEAPKIKLQHQ